MIIKYKFLTAVVSLLCLWASVNAYSASIDANNPQAVLESRGLAKDDNHSLAGLFDFSPFPANNHTVVPGFADPLGMGIDPGLRIFSGKVHFMDLLGNFDVARGESSKEIELPRNALKGINLLDNYWVILFAYNGRAFDTAQLNITGAEVIERDGLPVTTETSPLSLAGYGSVAENLRPIPMHWTRCPGRDKRLATMRKSMNQHAHPCTVPAVCQCYVI